MVAATIPLQKYKLKLEADASAVSEEMNVAWAAHEIVSDTTVQMLEWFERQQAALKGSLQRHHALDPKRQAEVTAWNQLEHHLHQGREGAKRTHNGMARYANSSTLIQLHRPEAAHPNAPWNRPVQRPVGRAARKLLN